jgi:hypothetical protein
MHLIFEKVNVAPNLSFSAAAAPVPQFQAEKIAGSPLFEAIDKLGSAIISAVRIFPSILYFNLEAVSIDNIEFDNEGNEEVDNSGKVQFYR